MDFLATDTVQLIELGATAFGLAFGVIVFVAALAHIAAGFISTRI